ncbi:MAG: hypothetical protein JNL79_32255 [Myxococcales bacterium]|nr:hypothetical protein [Myxococcales bacterium]
MPPAADERVARKLVGAARWLTVPTVPADLAVERALRRQAVREWNAPLTTERALPLLPVLASIATGLGAVAFGVLLSSGPGGSSEVGAAIGFAALVALLIAECLRTGREARQQRARYTTPDPSALDTYRALAPPSDFRGNLQRLLALLDREDPDERVLSAEVLRELGRFDEALALLAGVEDSPWSATVAREARRGHRFVARVSVRG